MEEKMPDNKLLDKTAAIEMIGGDEDVYDSILQTFAEVYCTDMSQTHPIKTLLTIEPQNIFKNETVRQEAHKIKGAAYTVGASALGDAALKIEQFVRDGQDGKIETSSSTEQTAASILSEFREVYKKTINLIKQ